MTVALGNPSLSISTQKLNQFKEYIQLRDDVADNVMLNFGARGYVNPQDSKRVTYMRVGGIGQYGRGKKVDGFKKIKLTGQVVTSEIKEYTSAIELSNFDIRTQRENLVNISASVLKRNMLADLENDIYLSVLKSATQYDATEGSATDSPSNLSEEDIRAVETLLDGKNCRRITPYIIQPEGADRYNVNNIPSSYIFVVPTQAQRKLKTFIPTLREPSSYGWNMVPYARELGSVSNTRLIASNFLDSYAETNSSDTGKTVYTGFMFGFQAFGCELIPENTEIFFQDPKDISPGGMTGYVVSKIFGSSVVLNSNWIYKVKFVTEE